MASSTEKPRALPSRNRAPRLHMVLDVLREHGPMSTPDIAEVLGWTPHQVVATVSPARATYPGQCLRIVAHLRVEGEWRPYVAIYSAEGGNDARKPTKKERARAAQDRYRQKYGQALRIRDRARRQRERNSETRPVNPWMQLAPRGLRARMGQIAANTTMAEAA